MSELAAASRPAVDEDHLRRTLLRRLMDVVAMPASSGSVQDRAIAGDLLLELLLDSDTTAREMCARRLQDMSQAPKRLLRFLAMDAPPVARLILTENKGLDEADLAQIAQLGGAAHRAAIAARRDVGPAVSAAIAESGDTAAMETLLQNPTARIAERAIDLIVTASREAPRLPPLLIQREEMRPAHALAMFWWSGPEERREILIRFSAERTHLIDNCADLFRQVGVSGVSDPLIGLALKVIERRQRDRAIIASTRFESLEAAVEEAARRGLDARLAETISVLSGIRPGTGLKILSDRGGEGVAVLCKATGLRRAYFRLMWAALGRGETDHDGRMDRVADIYETLAVAKAQTVLRYWDWRLSAAFSPDAMSDRPDGMDATGL
jgi:uncharacterized protein (DUF2336 family)